MNALKKSRAKMSKGGDRRVPSELRELLSIPTAPFREYRIIEFVNRFCRRYDIAVQQDGAGNLLLTPSRGKRSSRRRICFAAHMDHPGFVAEKTNRRGLLSARWYGGVAADRFVGQSVRFWTDGGIVRGRIESAETERAGRRRRVIRVAVKAKGDVPPDSIGMWDLPDPYVRGSNVYARACDDLAGVAAILSLLRRLARRDGRCRVIGLLTRAEEVGFVGATAACRANTVPKTTPIITLECSKALPHARLGDGPIIRVGDSMSIFSPDLTDLIVSAARGLSSSSRSFAFQRRLMDGGACESTLFQVHGRQTSGLCLALGNYHNMTEDGGIGPEFIDVRDYRRLVDLMEQVVEQAAQSVPSSADLRKDLDAVYSSYRRFL
jgi:endoglucanase